MNLKQITEVYFSPTDSTRKVVELITDQIAGNRGLVDLTGADQHRPDYSFLENEAVIVGAPVYGGRIPAVEAERLRLLHGNHTPVVLVVVYGNRAYDDALLELKNIMVEQRFRPVAAAAVSAEHNIVRSIAAGRPDEKDKELIVQFGRRVGERLQEEKSGAEISELTVKGNKPYREYHGIPMKINVSSSCTGCGTCIKKCPVQAISRTDPKITDQERCIGCMRCISVCPVGGRRVSRLLLMAMSHKLKKVCAGRKEPEFF